MSIGDSFPQSNSSQDPTTPQVRYISHPDILDDGEPYLITIEVPKSPAGLAIEAFESDDSTLSDNVEEPKFAFEKPVELPKSFEEFIELVQATAAETVEEVEPEVTQPADEQEAIAAMLQLETEKYRLKDIVLNLEQEIDDLRFQIRQTYAAVKKVQTDFKDQQQVVQNLVDQQSYLAEKLFEKDPFEMGAFTANVRKLKELKVEKDSKERTLSKNPVHIKIIALQAKLAKAQIIYVAYCEQHSLDQ